MRTILRVLGLPALLVLAWWAYSASADNFYVPDPGRVAQAFAALEPLAALDDSATPDEEN